MQFFLKPFGEILLLAIAVVLSLYAARPTQAALILTSKPDLIAQNLAALNAKKCLKGCTMSLVECFSQNPAALTAPVFPLDACRDKANSCISSCNVPNTLTVSCEDRCATTLEGCMIKAKTDKDKMTCQTSNKACLLKACKITASQLATDYCSKQCDRGYDICAVDNGMKGVACQTVQTACVKACPVATAASVGTRFSEVSPTVLKTNFNTILTDLRSLNFNFKSFSVLLKQWSAQTCPDIVLACEQEYKLCAANADQAMDTQLLLAKNECIQTCEARPVKCFGVEKTICKPAQKQICGCADNTSGLKTCNAKGTAWSACVCAPPQVCVPKSTTPCACATGEVVGSKTCADDGRGYGSCVCETVAVPITIAPAPEQTPPPMTPQNCYAQGSNMCPAGGNDYMYLCAKKRDDGSWWTGEVWTGCTNNPICPCPTAPPPPGGCVPGERATVSCMNENAPQGGSMTKTCLDGTWVSGSCKPLPVCNPNIPNHGQCLPPPIAAVKCYRGVAYSIYDDLNNPGSHVWGKCVGASTSGRMLNDCGINNWLTGFSDEASLKSYVDTIYNTTIPRVQPGFVYTQC